MWSDWAGPTLLCVHIWCAACRLWPAPVSRASHSPAAANQRAESGGSDQWEIMSLAQSSRGSVKKMLIVPKMQPQSLCEFIKSFNGIRFVVYKWRKEFPTFSVSRDQLERAWTTPDTGLTRLYWERGERPPHQSELCHDFLVTINFLPRPRVFSEEF